MPTGDTRTSGVSKTFLSCGKDKRKENIFKEHLKKQRSMQCICSHLQAEGCNDRLVVTDSIAHVTGVFILGDQDWILILFFICGSWCLLIIFLWWQGLGFDAPEDPVCPCRLPLLSTENRIEEQNKIVLYCQCISTSKLWVRHAEHNEHGCWFYNFYLKNFFFSIAYPLTHLHLSVHTNLHTNSYEKTSAVKECKPNTYTCSTRLYL